MRFDSLRERLQGPTLLYVIISAKLFQIIVPLYANVRWPVAVAGICNKSRLRVWRAWMPERLVNLSTRYLGARPLEHF